MLLYNTNTVFKQNVGIPMKIDPVPFWPNLLFYVFESKDAQKLDFTRIPRAYRYHGTS